MTVDLEDRLRTTFERVLPLLFDEAADEPGVSPESVALVGSAARPARGRRLLVATCVAIVIAMVAVIAVVRDRDEPVTPADTAPAELPTTTTAAAVPADAPEWYGWIKPFLPEGFDFVATRVIGNGAIYYTAINRMTNVSLDIDIQSNPDFVDLNPVVGADPEGDWTELSHGYELHTRSHRKVTVDCGIGDSRSSYLDTPDFCAADLDMPARRAMTLAIASSFPFDQIDPGREPFPTVPGYVDLDLVRALMEPALPDQVWQGQGDQRVDFGYPAASQPTTTASILHSVFPADDLTWAQTTLRYGDSSVGWTLRSGTAVRLFSAAGGDQLPRLDTLLADIADLVAGGVDEPVDATASTVDGSDVEPGQSTYTVIAGDTLVHIAALFCTDINVLVAENGWTDGPDHALFPGDRLDVPQPGCPATSAVGTVEPTTSPTTVVATATTVASNESSPDDVSYQIRSGDVLVVIANSFCVTAEELVAANGWVDGFEHQLVPDDVIRIPATACVRGRPTTFGSSSTSAVIAGDSAGAAAATWLASIGVEVSDTTRVSSGLVRPDFYDWPAALVDVLSTIPDGAPLVFAVGGNDGQPFLDTGDPVGSPPWVAEYTNRVLKIVDLATGSGHPLVWLGVPDVADPALDAALVAVRSATEAALAGVADVVYVDAAQIVAGPDSGYAETSADLSGNQVVVRTSDGIGLTPVGQELVGKRVLLALQAYDMPVEHEPISAGGVYTVQAGDYLAGIAAKSGTTVDEIVAANGWDDGVAHMISLGDKIRLPAKPG